MNLIEAKDFLNNNGYELIDEGLFDFFKKKKETPKKPTRPVKKEDDPAEKEKLVKLARNAAYGLKWVMGEKEFDRSKYSVFEDLSTDTSYNCEELKEAISAMERLTKKIKDERRLAKATQRGEDSYNYDRAREASEESRIRTGIGRR